MRKLKTKIYTSIALTLLIFISTTSIAHGYTLNTTTKYWYSSLTGIKNFSLQGTGTYDFPGEYLHKVQLGNASATACSLQPTWSINSSNAYWSQSTTGNIVTNTLNCSCVAGWHVLLGQLDFTQLKEVSMSHSASMTTFKN